MATARTATGASFMLAVDGVACGLVSSVDGGGLEATLVEAKDGTSTVLRKHIASFDYTPLTVDIGFDMAHAVFDWVAATWSGTLVRKDCSITTADSTMNAKSVQQFQQALVTAFGVPALAAGSKDVLRFSLTVTADAVRTAPGSGKLPTAGVGTKQKALVSNFRLEIDGVDCSGVRKIDPFSVQLEIVEDRAGTSREPQKVPGRLVFPNVTVTLVDGPKAAGWQSWAEDTIVNGNHEEKNGAIVFLGPDLKTELGRVQLFGLGICGLGRAKQTAHADTAPTLVAELFCQGMELQVGSHAPPPPVPPAPAPKPILDPQHPVTPLRG